MPVEKKDIQTWYITPIADHDRKIEFKGEWINIYHSVTKESIEKEENVDPVKEFTIPKDYVCEIMDGGKGYGKLSD